MIRLVAFDMDGTVADTVPMCIEAFREAVSPYAGHLLSEEEIVQTFGLNEIGMVGMVVKENADKALIDFYIKYEELHAQCTSPFPGIISLINMPKQNNIIVALVTGKGKTSCGITLNKFRMEDTFSDVMTGNAVKNNKKDSLVALKEKYHLTEDECIYIGDVVSDVAAARAAGMKCLSAGWGASADIPKLNEVNEGNVFLSIGEVHAYLRKLVEN